MGAGAPPPGDAENWALSLYFRIGNPCHTHLPARLRNYHGLREEAAVEQVWELEGRPVWREPVVFIKESGESQVGSSEFWDRKQPRAMELC